MSHPRRAAWVAWEVLEGRAVLFDEQACEVHLLNEAATAVWKLLDGTRDTAAIVAALAPSGPPASRIGPEVDALVTDLSRLGLVETS